MTGMLVISLLEEILSASLSSENTFNFEVLPSMRDYYADGVVNGNSFT